MCFAWMLPSNYYNNWFFIHCVVLNLQNWDIHIAKTLAQTFKLYYFKLYTKLFVSSKRLFNKLSKKNLLDSLAKSLSCLMCAYRAV